MTWENGSYAWQQDQLIMSQPYKLHIRDRSRRDVTDSTSLTSSILLEHCIFTLDTGIQVITPLYQRDRVQGPLLSDHLRRWTDTITCPTPTTDEDDDGIDRFEEAFHFSIVDLAWFHPE